MKRLILIGLAFLMIFSVNTVSAYTIDYTYALDGTSDFTSPVAGATVETFDNNSLLWTWSGNYAVVSGSQSSEYAAPHGLLNQDTSKYVTVPTSSSSGSVTVTNLGGTFNYFGLWWGSIDTYNTLSFYLDGSEVLSFGGNVVSPLANGNWTDAATNRYVNFYDLPDFNSFVMTSTQKAFEADNIAVGRTPVPEPGTLLLLGSGLAGLALYRRRSMNK